MSDPQKLANTQGQRPAGGSRNVRTALIMLSIAAFFFAGVIVNRYLFPVN
jgi:hypothetical protein